MARQKTPFTAKYDGTCAFCECEFKAGDPIFKAGTRYRHADTDECQEYDAEAAAEARYFQGITDYQERDY